jgi:hypothetical protein
MSCFRPASSQHIQKKIRHRTRRKNYWMERGVRDRTRREEQQENNGGQRVDVRGG